MTDLRLQSTAIIPARYDSTRFPGKILAPLLGKPMVQWVYENVSRCSKIDAAVVATDSEAILRAVKDFGGKALLTPEGFQSGSDRVAWAAKDSPSQVIINVQGDEPLLKAQSIDRLVEALENHPEWDIATLAFRMDDAAALQNPNVVKVVTALNGEALYFSRQPLAHGNGFSKHIGIYAYRKEALLRLASLPASDLERAERLEQLRALENGMRIGVVFVDEDTLAVDMPSDVKAVEERLMQGRFHIGNS